jgi:hypothetical protein
MGWERAIYNTCSGFGVLRLPSVASYRQKLFFASEWWCPRNPTPTPFFRARAGKGTGLV